MLTVYQQGIAARLEAGCRLERRMRRTGFGYLWDHAVVVLVDEEGAELETVRRPTVEALVAVGYEVGRPEEREE